MLLDGYMQKAAKCAAAPAAPARILEKPVRRRAAQVGITAGAGVRA